MVPRTNNPGLSSTAAEIGPAILAVLDDPSFAHRAGEAAAQIATVPDPCDVLRHVILARA